MKNLKFATLLFILSAVLAGCGGSGGGSASSDLLNGYPYWTILVYMNGDNNLEPEAIADINKLETVGSTPEVSVVVQIDRTPGYDSSNGNWTGTRRYFITKDNNQSIINSTLLADLGELDMADPRSLNDFILWATQTYPADNYMLVLWDHGRGWETRTLAVTPRKIRAINVDDTSGTEMSLEDLTQALQGVPKLSIVLFDACLMGMLEVGYAIRDSAELMVASEENVPAQGQLYDRILSRLRARPNMTPLGLSRAIIDDYMAHYMSVYSGTLTLSAVRLESLNAVASTVDSLAGECMANMAEVRQSLRAAQSSVQRYDYDKNLYKDYKDLYHFAALVRDSAPSPTVTQAAQSVLDAVTGAVYYERNSGGLMANSHGISIYIPPPGSMLSDYSYIMFSRNTRWDEFLNAY